MHTLLVRYPPGVASPAVCLAFDLDACTVGDAVDAALARVGAPPSLAPATVATLAGQAWPHTATLAEACGGGDGRPPSSSPSSTHSTALTLALRLAGGKGGFGSLLRASGRVAKVTNFDACRDLSGRRIGAATAEAAAAAWAADEEGRALEAAALRHVREAAAAARREAARAAADAVDGAAVRAEAEAAVAATAAAVAAGVSVGEGGGGGGLAAAPVVAPAGPRARRVLDELVGSGSDDDDDEDEEGEARAAPAKAAAAKAPAVVEAAPPPPPLQPPLPAPAAAPAAMAVPRAPTPPPPPAAIDLDAHASADALACAVSPDALKAALAAAGLKVGGTALQRAQRLWLLKGGKGRESVPRQHWAKQ